MTAYNQKTIEKLAASRLKKVMSGLLRAGDRTKYDQLLGQMRGSLNKGGARIPENADFTKLYRRMQAPPTVPAKSLRLKDRLSENVLRKLTDSGKTYEIKRGVGVKLNHRGVLPDEGSFETSLASRTPGPWGYMKFRRYMRAPRQNIVGKVRSYVLPNNSAPGDVRSVLAHELAEAVDSVPAQRARYGLSKRAPNKQTPMLRRFLRGVAGFMRGREAPTRLSLYPKGQGRYNFRTRNILRHYSTNPLLAERLHTRGRMLFDRTKPKNLFFPEEGAEYRIPSTEAERILRNVGNVGGYTPPPYGRAAGKANLQLEKQLRKGTSRLAEDQMKREKYTLDGISMGSKGRMLGDDWYTPDY